MPLKNTKKRKNYLFFLKTDLIFVKWHDRMTKNRTNVFKKGGLADATRHEVKTGKIVGGKSHIQKGAEQLKNYLN